MKLNWVCVEECVLLGAWEFMSTWGRSTVTMATLCFSVSVGVIVQMSWRVVTVRSMIWVGVVLWKLATEQAMHWQMRDATWVNRSTSASLSTGQSFIQSASQSATQRGRTQLSEQASIILHYLLIHPVGFFLFGMGSSVKAHQHTNVQPCIHTRACEQAFPCVCAQMQHLLKRKTHICTSIS